MKAKSKKKKPSSAKQTGSAKTAARSKPGYKKARKRTGSSSGDEGPPTGN